MLISVKRRHAAPRLTRQPIGFMQHVMDARARPSSRRGPGRRPAGTAGLDRADILARGLELSKTVPLQDLSIVRLASVLGVTPASIHYHLAGRDDLTSGIINLFISRLIAEWPRPTGRWRIDLEAVSQTVYRYFLAYPGISSYFAIQNRFKVLIPAVESDERALFGFLERFFAAVRAVGLDPQRSATYAVLIIQFIHTAAHRTASHQWPGEQERLETYVMALDATRFPSIAFMREDYLHLAGDAAFQAGLRLLLSGLEAERRDVRKKRG